MRYNETMIALEGTVHRLRYRIHDDRGPIDHAYCGYFISGRLVPFPEARSVCKDCEQEHALDLLACVP